MPVPGRSRVAPLLVGAVLAGACTTPGADVAATVGDATVRLGQLQTRASVYRAVGRLSGQPCGAPEDGESEESACNRFALTQLVQTAISSGYARAHGIQVDAQEVEDAVAGFENGVGSEAMSAALRAEGIDRGEVLAAVRDILLTRQVGEAVTEEGLGETALRSAYQEGIAQFTTVRVAHILVETEAEADGVYRRVTADGATHATFARLARRRSIDTGSASRGGDLGSTVASSFVPAFADAVVALDVGQISRPIHTEFGWHVVRLDDEQVTPYEEAKPQLLQQLGAGRYLAWLRDRSRLLDVQVNPRFGRLDPTTMTVLRVSSTAVDASPSPAGASVAPASP